VSVLNAWLDGWRRVFRAPVLVVGLLALTALHTVSPHVVRSQGRLFHPGAVSTEDADLAVADAQILTTKTFGIGWIVVYPQFGLGRSGGVPAGLITPFLFAPMPLLPPVMPMLGMVSENLLGAIGFLFLAGGVIDRLARGRSVGSHAFFGACGGYVFRFIRLGVPLGVLYWVLLRWIYPWMIGPLFMRFATGGGINRVEAVRLAIYSAFTVLLVMVSVIGDYAMVRAVVEDRRSALGSLAAATRFVRRRLLRVLALYALTAVLPMIVLSELPRFLVATGIAAIAGDSAIVSFVVFSVFMLLVLLAYLASATAFFQSQLAHAQYTAAPEAVWPESPAAEAIRNLRTS